VETSSSTTQIYGARSTLADVGFEVWNVVTWMFQLPLGYETNVVLLEPWKRSINVIDWYVCVLIFSCPPDHTIDELLFVLVACDRREFRHTS
jgi:hypothetical protein